MGETHKPNLVSATTLIKEILCCVKIDLSEIENRGEIHPHCLWSLCGLLLCFVFDRSRGINVEPLKLVEGNR